MNELHENKAQTKPRFTGRGKRNRVLKRTNKSRTVTGRIDQCSCRRWKGKLKIWFIKLYNEKRWYGNYNRQYCTQSSGRGQRETPKTRRTPSPITTLTKSLRKRFWPADGTRVPFCDTRRITPSFVVLFHVLSVPIVVRSRRYLSSCRRLLSGQSHGNTNLPTWPTRRRVERITLILQKSAHIYG